MIIFIFIFTIFITTYHTTNVFVLLLCQELYFVFGLAVQIKNKISLEKTNNYTTKIKIAILNTVIDLSRV